MDCKSITKSKKERENKPFKKQKNAYKTKKLSIFAPAIRK